MGKLELFPFQLMYFLPSDGLLNHIEVKIQAM